MTTPAYTRDTIIQALRTAGVSAGRVVFVHSNLGFFGRCADVDTADALSATFLDAFQTVLGAQGTLLVPTFSYSFCRQESFDPSETPSTCGQFSEYCRRHPAAHRSHDANFSMAAIGHAAHALTRDVPDHPFGPDSVCDRFLQADGLFCNLNFDAGSTFLHFVERSLRVPYRYDKAFPGIVQLPTGPHARTFYHFVYDLDRPEDGPEFTKFSALAQSHGMIGTANLGRGQLLTISARDTFDLIAATLPEHPWLLRRGNGQ